MSFATGPVPGTRDCNSCMIGHEDTRMQGIDGLLYIWSVCIYLGGGNKVQDQCLLYTQYTHAIFAQNVLKSVCIVCVRDIFQSWIGYLKIFFFSLM